MAERRYPEYLALMFVAGLYFAWGCTSGLDLSDEGQIVFASWRTAEGSIPYRDFGHLYGPSLFFLNGALLRWCGEDLLVLRVSLVILKSLTAVLVYMCARLAASRAFSLLAYFLVLAIWGTPWVFNTPYSNHYALTLTLAGIVVFVASRHRFYLACFLAGLCFGLCATFKQTTGMFCVLWFALFLLMERPSSEPASSPPPTRIHFVARSIRWTVLLAALGATLAYQATGTTAWNALVISGPLLVAVVFLSVRELRGMTPPRQCIHGAVGIAACGAGAGIPVLAYVALYASLGHLHDLVFNTVTLGAMVRWFVPLPLPGSRTFLCAAAIVTMFLAARLWRSPGKGRPQAAAAVTVLFSISIYLAWSGISMPAGVWAFLRSGNWYADAFRIMYFLPLGIVLVAVPALLRDTDGRSSDAEKRGDGVRQLLFIAAAGSLLSLHPAADLWHVFMVLPMFLPILSWELDAFHRVPRSNGMAGRLVSASAAVLFAVFLAAPFVHATARAWIERPPPALRMKRATGIVGLTSQLAQQVELVSYLEGRSERGLLVLTNEQLLYFLSGGVPAMEEQEFVLYLVGGGLIGDEDARALVPEGPFIERLKATKPTIVDAADHRMAKRFRDVFPNVARFIDENYRLEKAIGTYRVLADETT